MKIKTKDVVYLRTGDAVRKHGIGAVIESADPATMADMRSAVLFGRAEELTEKADHGKTDDSHSRGRKRAAGSGE